jgi:hypothetical protein
MMGSIILGAVVQAFFIIARRHRTPQHCRWQPTSAGSMRRDPMVPLISESGEPDRHQPVGPAACAPSPSLVGLPPVSRGGAVVQLLGQPGLVLRIGARSWVPAWSATRRDIVIRSSTASRESPLASEERAYVLRYRFLAPRPRSRRIPSVTVRVFGVAGAEVEVCHYHSAGVGVSTRESGLPGPYDARRTPSLPPRRVVEPPRPIVGIPLPSPWHACPTRLLP